MLCWSCSLDICLHFKVEYIFILNVTHYSSHCGQRQHQGKVWAHHHCSQWLCAALRGRPHTSKGPPCPSWSGICAFFQPPLSQLSPLTPAPTTEHELAPPPGIHCSPWNSFSTGHSPSHPPPLLPPHSPSKLAWSYEWGVSTRRSLWPLWSCSFFRCHLHGSFPWTLKSWWGTWPPSSGLSELPAVTLL